MRHRLVVIIWNGEEMGEAPSNIISLAFELYGVKLKQAVTVIDHKSDVGNAYLISRYISQWTARSIDLTRYQEILACLPVDAEPEVLIELETPESDQY